jgi:hypothetical protein
MGENRERQTEDAFGVELEREIESVEITIAHVHAPQGGEGIEQLVALDVLEISGLP